MNLREHVREIVGDGILTDPADTAAYATDWTGAHRGHTPLVALPRSAEEVAGLIQLAREHALALVPQGGNTGLVAGGVPMDGEIVVSTQRLRSAPQVDVTGSTALAGAGVPLQVLQAAAAQHGMQYGVDTASRGTATIGGTLSTNAGGLRVMRYGDTRAQVIGVDAVLGTGEIIRRTTGLARDNSGYQLPSLLTGSEGTLAVVTSVQVRLRPAVTDRAVALIGFQAPAAAVRGALALRRTCPDLSAVELMLSPGMNLVASQPTWRFPLAEIPSAALIVEVTADRALDVLTDAIASLTDVTDAVMDDAERGRDGLWRWRESHTECIGRVDPPVKLDVTLPASALEEFLANVPGLVQLAVPGTSTWLFGHIADGNVHVNVTGTGGAGDPARRVTETVFTKVAQLGGSISTEHGIGRTKREWLHLTRSASEIEAGRAIKAALDPDGVLNPNVLFPSIDAAPHSRA